jgi:enoyl-CoA hydratase/carnithine racemase
MQWIKWEVKEGVAVAVMDHEKENRFSGPFAGEVREAMAALDADEAVKAVVMTGAHEKFFCNGLDLAWMMQQDAAALEKFLLQVTRVLKDTALFGKPLIAAVNGHAFGLGAIWSSGFDFRVMREDRGWVCFPEMDINIPFLPGMIAICEHGLGRRVFREMAFSAKRYSGHEAVAVGWAREAVPKDQLLSRAVELARFMAQKKQPAFSLTKQRWAREVAHVIDELDPAAIASAPLPGK